MAIFKKNKTEITDVKQLNKLGLQTNVKRLNRFGSKFIFETPVSVGSATFRGDCSAGYLSYFRENTIIDKTTIGRFCAFAPNVFVGGGEHPTDWLSVHSFQYGGGTVFNNYVEFTGITGNRGFQQPGRTSIGNDVWVGQGAVISRGIRIGDGAIIGAQALVTRDVEPYTIVGGVPAKPIRRRFADDMCERLLQLTWWNYDLAPIAKKINYSQIVKAVDLLEKSIEQGILHPLKPSQYTLSKKADYYYLTS